MKLEDFQELKRLVQRDAVERLFYGYPTAAEDKDKWVAYNLYPHPTHIKEEHRGCLITSLT